jgi:outer membrane protein
LLGHETSKESAGLAEFLKGASDKTSAKHFKAASSRYRGRLKVSNLSWRTHMFQRFVGLAVVLVSMVSHAADFKAAYVDVQRAVQEVDEGKAAKARLQVLVGEKQKTLEKEQTTLKAEKDAYDKQASTMTDQARRAKEDDLQKKFIDFQQRAEKFRTDMAEQERKELGSIFPKLEALLGQIAQRDGFTMIFDRSASGLAWAPPSLDVTNELIRMYNANAAKSPGTAPKADAPKAPAK